MQIRSDSVDWSYAPTALVVASDDVQSLNVRGHLIHLLSRSVVIESSWISDSPHRRLAAP